MVYSILNEEKNKKKLYELLEESKKSKNNENKILEKLKDVKKSIVWFQQILEDSKEREIYSFNYFSTDVIEMLNKELNELRIELCIARDE